eukprot:scaffold55802_cov80-Phaeocystis_antarctica.AAC.2
MPFEAAGRAACVSDARSSLFSLLFAAVAAAQSIRLLCWLPGWRKLRRGARLLRRPSAGADARGVGDTLPLAALYGDSGSAVGDTVPARRGGATAAAQGVRDYGAITAQALRLGVSQCGLALRLQRGAAAQPAAAQRARHFDVSTAQAHRLKARTTPHKNRA